MADNTSYFPYAVCALAESEFAADLGLYLNHPIFVMDITVLLV